MRNEIDLTAATPIMLRVRREDSAFVYAVLEASEGVAMYSTVRSEPYCDLELWVPHGMMDEAQSLIKSLGEMVYEIKSTPKDGLP